MSRGRGIPFPPASLLTPFRVVHKIGLFPADTLHMSHDLASVESLANNDEDLVVRNAGNTLTLHPGDFLFVRDDQTIDVLPEDTFKSRYALVSKAKK